MYNAIRSSVLSITIVMLTGLSGQALAQQNDNSTVQIGKVNINRTAQCGEINTNTTYQEGKVNINQTAQGCRERDSRKGPTHGKTSQRTNQSQGRPAHAAAGRKW